MPKYYYIAKSSSGEKKSGVLESKDAYQLARELRQLGFVLIKARTEESMTKEKLHISLPSFGGVSIQEKMFFIRNLHVMISAGLALPRAIGSLADQMKNNVFRQALLDIRDQINKGKNLSSALASHPDVFSHLFCSMIRAGEKSGTLEKILKTLELQLEKENNLKEKVKGAMIYPAVIVVAMTAVGALMLITVIPKLAETFEDLNTELPVTTKFVIGLGSFLSQNWHLMIIGMVGLVIIISRALKIEEIKKVADRLFLKLPVFSPILKSTN